MQDLETTPLESESSTETFLVESKLPGWIKVGAIAAASALAGGLAAAWYYRNTLDRLRQAESNGTNADFGIREDAADNDT
jgi:hypothetical protein